MRSSSNVNLKVGKGYKIRFWDDSWLGVSPLAQRFPVLYRMSNNKIIQSVRLVQNFIMNGGHSWNLSFVRNMNDRS